MEIVMLSGASSIHTIRWANSLSEAGVKVHLISQHSEIEPLNPEIFFYKFPFRGVLGYFAMVPKVKKLLQKIDPDIVSAHFASGYATTARLVGFRPWLLSLWGSDVYEFPYKSSVHKYWVKSNLMAADCVASTSYCMAEQARSIAPSLESIAITPFGVDTQYFASSTTPLTGRTTEAPIVIGTIKTLEPKYGVDILIDAFSLVYYKLRETRLELANRLRLRLVGDGPQRSILESKAKHLGLEGRVEFVGRVRHDQVPIELEKLDIYVALSRQESFGVAIIEAGAAARPVVVSDAGGLPEVVEKNKTGLIVPCEDPQAAAEALLHLIEDPELRIRLGQAGQEHVKRTYDWSTCVQKMIFTFEQVAKLGKP